MKDWILHGAHYFLSNWEDLLAGGVVVMSVVIFLMGCLKKIAINRIKHDLLRKIILAWSSVLLTLPLTAASVVANGFDWNYFWTIYAGNSIQTILVYWLYENTALRDGLAWFGKSTLGRFIGAASGSKDLASVNYEVNQEAKTLVAKATKSTSKYRDDDLKKL